MITPASVHWMVSTIPFLIPFYKDELLQQKYAKESQIIGRVDGGGRSCRAGAIANPTEHDASEQNQHEDLPRPPVLRAVQQRERHGGQENSQRSSQRARQQRQQKSSKRQFFA